MIIKSATFIKSSPTLKDCPTPLQPEFAFFGRSNVGKSSLINALTQRKTLAKASNTPGKTRLLNFFLINDQWQIVDLPGYGYAKANDTEKKSWLNTIQNFLTKRETLKKVFLLIDASIPPQRIDLEMLGSFVAERIDFAIIFTKIDKSTQKERSKNFKLFTKELSKITRIPPLFFSVDNISGKGRDDVLNYIETLL
ncbi:MAG: ribosome biogenesis GTP-binding protein YihA/YsxC [Candidatus Peribacteria bacterium]|jgi:GTP-binding protein|nr:ribosome biogenesis GTP-binding protein YihA/YsxC [Candidatus Peribacteria bacterium]